MRFFELASNSSPSRTASSSSSRPAASASAITRGPSRRTRPGSRRWARRLMRRTISFSGLEISWSSESFFGNLDQLSKGTAVAHGQVSQHFAVDLHSCLAEAVHELVVRQPRLTRGGVDARDPELTHLALAPPPVAKRVSERVEDRLVAAVSRDASLDSCHGPLDPQCPPHRLAVGLGHRLRVLVVPLAFLGLVLE